MIPSICQNAIKFKIKVTAKISVKETNMPFLIFLTFLSPTVTEKNALLPRQSQNITDVKNVISVYDEPTAAKALSPMYLPTIHVSAKLYNCCITLHKIRGAANAQSLDVIFPFVKS